MGEGVGGVGGGDGGRVGVEGWREETAGITLRVEEGVNLGIGMSEPGAGEVGE